MNVRPFVDNQLLIYDGSTGAEINGNVVKLHFIDGDRGDDELTQDGMIIDIGGPGVDSSNVTPGSNPKTGSGGGTEVVVLLMKN